MPDASFLQTSYLGGEWSPYYQGRMEDPRYRAAMNVCRNGLPVEEGAWTRRSGTRFAATTRKGVAGQLREFQFTQAQPYNMEFTAGHIRFFQGPSLVLEQKVGVASFTTASPTLVRTLLPHGWNTLDEVQFFFTDGSVDAGVATLLNRQFEITKVDASSFTIADPVDGTPVDGSTLALIGGTLAVARVVDVPTVYTLAQVPDIRVVQNENVLILLHKQVRPYIMTSTPPALIGDPEVFTFTTATFNDGPYLDPPNDASTVTPSGVSGTIGLTWSSVVNVNGGNGFQATDLGRAVRLFSEPLDWSAVTAYAVGDTVKFNQEYYSCLAVNTGQQPDLNINDWIINPSNASWSWGTIQTIVAPNQVTLTLAAADPTGEFAGGPLQHTNAIKTWRLGKYSDTTGWPSSGCYHENRFWMSNAANEFDASVSNGDSGTSINFCPTGPDGTVADNNGITEAIKSTDVNTIFWMQPDHQGIILGTQGGEWLIQASTLNDPLTPTSIQAHRVTKYGCANIEPRRTGLSNVFVHRYARKMMEYVSDAYSGKFSGTNLSITAKHLSKAGISEIAYVEETVPVVWARMTDGSLAGCTYKRESPFGTQPASFSGWHRHDLGSARLVESIQGGPSVHGDIDTLALVTNDALTNVRWVEFLTNVFEEDDDITGGFFVDGGTNPALAVLTDVNTVILYGYHYIVGKTVAVTFGGLDLGDYVVAADGTITVPINAPGSLFTTAYLAALTAEGGTFNDLGVEIIASPSGTVASPDVSGILEYVDGGGGVGTIGGSGADNVLPDWTRDRLFILKPGDTTDTPTAGIRRVRMSTPGGDQAAVTVATVFPAQASRFINQPNTIDAAGFLYWQSDVGNSGDLVKIDPNTLAFVSRFGTGQGAGVITNASFLQRTGALCTFQAGSRNWVASACAVSGSGGSSHQGQVSFIDTSNMSWPAGFTYELDEDIAHICPAPSINVGHYHAGGVFALGRAFYDGTVDQKCTSALGLYSIGTDGTNFGASKIGKITPEQINTHWHHFFQVNGLGYDETDGNVLFFASINAPLAWSSLGVYATGWIVRGSDGHDYIRTGAGSHSGGGGDPTLDTMHVNWTDKGAATYTSGDTFLVKASTADAHVMWTLSVLAQPTFSRFCLPHSRIAHGRYCFMSETPSSGILYPMYTVNTVTGTATTASVTNVPTHGGQHYDAYTGRVILYCDYTSGGAAPGRVPPTPASFVNDWAVFGPLGGLTTVSYFGPFTAGFTYTSQGQILRPIAPQEAGAANGPALAKTRREHQFGVLLHTSQGISFGTNFTFQNAAQFQSPGGTPYTALQAWSGVHWDTLNDDYSFDSMLAWQITRPHPSTVLTASNFLHTQDR